nr:uroporphyrinogen-III C-methyltransferase [Corynebacterium sp. c6VSa_13]
MPESPGDAHQVAGGGTVTLVGGGPGAWDLMTVRALRALESAEVILADHLGPGSQLEQCVDLSDKLVIDVSKMPYGKQVSQERINELLIEHARAGRRVVRLKGGDPFVFGRGFEEWVACAAAGVECHVVPGVTSAVAVPGLAQVPVTQRGVVHAFTVVSGHVPPGDPRSKVDWAALAASGATLAIIMGVRHIAAIADTLIAAGLDPDMPAAAIQDGSLSQQRMVRSTVARVAADMREAELGSPAVIVIGEVAGLTLPGA